MPTLVKKLINPGIYSLLYFFSIFIVYKLAVLRAPMALVGREELVSDFILKSDTIFWQMSFFVVAILVLYLIPLIVMIRSTNIVSAKWSFSQFHKISYFSAALLFLWFFVLGFNQLNFPWSTYTYILPLFYSDSLTLIISWVSLLFFLIIGVAPTLIKLFSRISSFFGPRKLKIAVAVLVAASAINAIPLTAINGKVSRSQPDIIFIGLDSIAPLHMQHNPGKQPYLQGLLDAGTSFSNSITPLARTFPAWTSILTGLYPVHTGARFNLIPLEKINHQPNLLPKILRRNGYHTVYAQDERKFNNIDESFGFDKVIGPRIGASEFILTHMSDIVFLNIFSLAPWSATLFPSIVNNRADYIHYSPENFTAQVLNNIPDDKDKPLFLAAHFCLAHYPYRWRSNKGRVTGSDPDARHQASMNELERQVSQLLSGLKEKGRLNNALLVILSDHGESMAYEDGLWLDPQKGDELYYPETEIEAPIAMASTHTGHGSQLLDKTQYKTLLSFQGFGAMASAFNPESMNEITSLVDIMPTVLAATNIPAPLNLDGRNLLADPQAEAKPRIALAETGIVFESLSSIKNINENSVLDEAKQYYTVNPDTGLLTLKPQRTDELIDKKNYAIHGNEWILAFIQHHKIETVSQHAVLIHKPSGRWTLGANLVLAEEAPLDFLLDQAVQLLGNELDKFSHTWVFNKTPEQPDLPSVH